MGLAFAYYLDFTTKRFIEQTVMAPLGAGCHLPPEVGADVTFANRAMSHRRRAVGRRVDRRHWDAENAFRVDGWLTKLSEDVLFGYDPSDSSRGRGPSGQPYRARSISCSGLSRAGRQVGLPRGPVRGAPAHRALRRPDYP